jgi:hypothetical protein
MRTRYRRNSGFSITEFRGVFYAYDSKKQSLNALGFRTRAEAEAAIARAGGSVPSTAAATPAPAPIPSPAPARIAPTVPPPVQAGPASAAAMPSPRSSKVLPPELSALVSYGPDLMTAGEYIALLRQVPAIKEAIGRGLLDLTAKGPYMVYVDYKAPRSLKYKRGNSVYKDDAMFEHVANTQAMMESLIDVMPGWAPARRVQLSEWFDIADWENNYHTTAHARIVPGLDTFWVYGRKWPQRLALRKNGAVGYAVAVDEPDVAKAFARAQHDAEEDVRYHQGYSGTIGEADGYKVVSNVPVAEKLAGKTAAKYGDSGKRGAAYAIPYTASKNETVTIDVNFQVPADEAEDSELRRRIVESKVAAAVAAAGHSEESILSTDIRGSMTVPPVRWVFRATPQDPLFKTWGHFGDHSNQNASGIRFRTLAQFIETTGSLRRTEPLTVEFSSEAPSSSSLTKTEELGLLVPEYQGPMIYNLKVTVSVITSAGGGIKGWYFWGTAPS